MYYDNLTKQEREILKYLVWGLSNAEIARMMWLCQGRVTTIICEIYRKYGIHENHRCKLLVKRLNELGINTRGITA